MILEHSSRLRLLTVFLFYFTQGVPVGLFFFAIPAWLGANGASTTAIAGLVSAAILPWTLKFFVGFIMDRYTYLPMGRRRIWIIGAQATIVAMLLVAAAISPMPSEIGLLSLLAFLANAGTAFQDVSIDSLVVDIMPEEERAKASGIMFGAQTLGIASTTFVSGQLIARYGLSFGFLVAAAIVAGILIFGIAMREREGEGRMPWSKGCAHPRNVAIQVEAWKPLLLDSAKAILAPISLVAGLVFVFTSMAPGVYEAYHPVLATGTGGWSQAEYTNTISASQLVSGLFAMTIGGWLISKVGAKRSAMVILFAVAIAAMSFGLARSYWSDGNILTTYFWLTEFLRVMVPVAFIPIAMRLCSPSVAATQFTLYMAASNIGRPIGSALAATADGIGQPHLMYFGLSSVLALLTLTVWRVRFPASAAEDISASAHTQDPQTREAAIA